MHQIHLGDLNIIDHYYYYQIGRDKITCIKQ